MINSKENLTEDQVLIVDDIPDQLELMSTSMQHAGYEVAEASNGFQAFEIAQHMRPALIISDVNMPGAIDSIDLTRMIRSNARLNETPILLVSALDQGTNFLAKPFTPNALGAEGTSSPWSL